MPDSHSPGWRDVGDQSSPTFGQRPWQAGESHAVEAKSAPSRRRLKRFLALFALFAFSVAIGYVIILLRPVKQACLVVIGSGYETNLLVPHNAHGWHGAQAMLADDNIAVTNPPFTWPWESSSKLRRFEPAQELKADRTWQDVWKNVSSFPEKTLLLFISAHALAEKDDVVLLTDDPTFKGRIHFKDILDSVSHLKAKQKNVVLFLDIAQVESHWPIGLLHNDVVQRLEKDYKAKIQEAGNLMVICAADIDQRAWTSDEWQNSVFAHFVAEGLRGAALKSTGKVTVRDLFNYVQQEVDHWAQTTRARRQKPVLWCKESLADEVGLLNIDSPYEPARSSLRDRTEEDSRLMWAWEEWEKLRAKKPFVHTPHVWRIYQESLLRYEQLVRAGDPTEKAKGMKEQLGTLAKSIEEGLTLGKALDSLTDSFPMYQVLGYRPQRERLDDLFTKIRRTEPDKWDEILAGVKTASAQDKAYLQVGLGREYLRELGLRTKLDRDTEQAWLASLEKSLRIPRRPAEMHLFKLLQDARPELDDEIYRLALRTRVLAEEAALSAYDVGRNTPPTGEPYSAVIYPWIEKDIKEADARRREGEDALFGNPEIHGKVAKKALEEAEGVYTKAREKSLVFQRALTVRDEVWSDLPEILRWLAMVPKGNMLTETENLRDGLAGFRENFLDLGRKLDAAEGAPNLGKVTALTKQVQSFHQEMRKKYKSASEMLTDVGYQAKWHEHESVLSIAPPAGSVELRLTLLKQMQNISSELHARFLKESADDKKERKLAEEPELLAHRLARQRSVLEAILSEHLAKGEPNLDPELQSFFAKLPEEITAKSQKDSDQLAPLMEAAQYCRFIPGGWSRDIVAPLDPVDRLRRLRMHSLLLAQAERTWWDHWFEPRQENLSTDAGAFYLNAGRAYLKSAGELVKEDRSRMVLDAKASAFSNEKMQLARLTTPNKDQNKYWTSQLALSLSFDIDDNPNVPPGTPMGWLEIGGGKGAKPKELGSREALEWPTTKPFPPLKKSDIWPDETVARRVVTFRGVYRGQQLKSDLTCELVKPEVFVTHKPPPPSAGLAVRMDPSFTYGAISIVLDNSGSMRFVHPLEFDEKKNEKRKDQYPDKKCRFDYALEALETVLDKIPDGTSLSFFRFFENTEKETDIEFLREPFPLARKAKELGDLRHDLKVMNKNLDNRYFKNSSPIARGIEVSLEKGFKGNYPGPKVVLVLTDGMDNYSFTKDPLNKELTTQKVADFIEATKANHKNTEIIVVCFMQDDDSERPWVKKQFGSLGANLVIEPNAKELGRKIVKVLQPTLKLSYAGEVVPELSSLPANFPEGELNWSVIPPNEYKAELSRTRDPGIEIDFRPGQNLFLVLKRDNRAFYLERGLIGMHTKSENTVRHEAKNWLVSLLGHGIDPKNTLEQLVTFEYVESAKKYPIRQIYPGFVWLELDAYKNGFAKTNRMPWGNTQLRWENAWDIAAPGFRVSMPWQEDADPKLTAWFWPRDRADFIERSFVKDIKLQIGAKRSANPDRLPAIESVEWERIKNEDVLVIRALCAEKNPVMVDFKQARPPGVRIEHQYYPRAGGYTAYIHGLRPQDEKHDFVMIDLAAFKAEAEKTAFPSGEEKLPQRIRLPTYFLGRSE